MRPVMAIDARIGCEAIGRRPKVSEATYPEPGKKTTRLKPLCETGNRQPDVLFPAR